MIPVLGGTLTSVWSDIDAIQAKRKHERLEEFYLSLEMEVQKIKEQINESYINQPDFLDVFEQTARHNVKKRKEFCLEIFCLVALLQKNAATIKRKNI